MSFHCIDYLFKLLLIGDASVGKSCLLLRFACGFIYFKQVNDKLILNCVSIYKKSLPWNSVKQWLNEVDRYASENVNKILVENKCDLTRSKVVSYETVNMKLGFFS
ncbi:hypothetical protein CRYUN_Cryun11dG0070800 [Craigia yunnanensis]